MAAKAVTLREPKRIDKRKDKSYDKKNVQSEQQL